MKISTTTLKKNIWSYSDSHTSSANNLSQTSISSRLDNKEISTNQHKHFFPSKDDIHSCVTPQKQNYSVHATYKKTHLIPLKATLPIVYIDLHTTNELLPVGKEYLCFHINGKSSHAAQCVKSRVINKAVDYILPADTFEQQCVLIKCMLQSPHIEYHMKNIGIDQSLINRPSVDQKCLNNIKRYINLQVSVITNKT